MTKTQVIFNEEGQPAFAVVPWQLYKRLNAFDPNFELNDEELYDNATVANEESFPIEVADRLLAGENAVKVYREYRGLTQKRLAKQIGINVVYLSQIETGRRTGSTKTLTKLAELLNVDLEDLI